jgi:hypothetical protein
MIFKNSVFLFTLLFSNCIFSESTYNPTLKVDCASKFPQNASYVNQMQFIRKWASYATRISFVINHDTSDSELQGHQGCFTNSGWSQYTQALHQSGNLITIKKNQFETSMMVNGDIDVKTDHINHMWKLHIPIDLVFQNNHTRIKQDLDVFMLVTLEADGHLAIMQVVGKPVDEIKPQTPPQV